MSQFNSAYVILSILVAIGSLKFVITNFTPPKLSEAVYASLSVVLTLTFIALSLEPPKSKFRIFTLFSLNIIFLLPPLIYHGKYDCRIGYGISIVTTIFGLKMLTWLKKSVYKNKDSKFMPFIWTLFYWREDEAPINIQYDATLQKKDGNNTNEFNPPTPTFEQIRSNMLHRLIALFTEYMVYEVLIEYLSIYKPEVPEKIYIFRILDFFETGSPFIAPYSLAYYYLYTIILYVYTSWCIDAILIVATLLLRNILINEKNNSNSFIFTPTQAQSVKKWTIHTLFYTRSMCNKPYLAISPRDFWTNRWHTVYIRAFKELAYSPARNIVKSKNLGKLLGVMSVYLMSGAMHDYIVFSTWGDFRGEHLTFFTYQGILFIGWELTERFITGGKNKNDGNLVVNIFKWVLFMSLSIISIPFYFEPYLRHNELSCLPKIGLINRYLNH